MHRKHGEWVRIRSDIHYHPLFFRVERLTGLSRAELLLQLYELALWFKHHAKYGRMRMENAPALDIVADRPGLFDALQSVGWIVVANKHFTLHYFCDASATRKSIGQKLRREVLDGACCAACGATENLEIDHKIPISRNGTTERSNLQPLCGPCNAQKHTMTMEEFMTSRGGA